MRVLDWAIKIKGLSDQALAIAYRAPGRGAQAALVIDRRPVRSFGVVLFFEGRGTLVCSKALGDGRWTYQTDYQTKQTSPGRSLAGHWTRTDVGLTMDS